MIKTEKEVYLQEMEIKPNTYAALVLEVCLVCIVLCWVTNEIGLFRVGKTEMRIGSIIPLIMVLVPLVSLKVNKSLISNPKTKYFIMAASIVLTASVTTLLTFHTTIMLLFPIFIAMLYRSRKLGVFALLGSVFCTVLSPVLAYIIGSWDIELFKELILIGTNGTAEIIGAYPAIKLISIAKILLYIVAPRLLMVGSCAILMFYVIKLGTAHVENQIMLNRVSQRDALTGLYNQNFFKEYLNMDKPDLPVGIIFFDVNGLKGLNDNYGHEYGDLLLKRCARSITDICSTDSEYGFRIGGDEFLMVIENATEELLLQKVDDWKQAIKQINEENKRYHYGIFCSMATGYTFGNMKDLYELIRTADTLMYKNKAEIKATRKE